MAGGPAAQCEIVGRERELQTLSDVLDSGGTVLLDGEAGIGKTTVLEHALSRARNQGFRVLAATPAQAEQSFTYGVLADLLADVDDQALAKLAPPQKRAMEQALRRSDDGERLEAFAVAIALHALLRQLVTDAPVVVAVDDVQWADRESAAALAYVLRRSPAFRSLLAARAGWALPLKAEWQQLTIGPLSAGALHHLIVERLGFALSRQSLLHVHAISGGNPFYGLELARTNAAGGPLVVPASLDDVVANRVRTLPRAARRALAELALAGQSARPADLAPAIAAGVVEIRPDGPRFSHPLLAEGAVGLLGADELRELHAEIAGWTTDADRRARHRALAATAPDESVASELAAAATATRWRSTLSAAELWELAAKLTPLDTPDILAARLVEAGMAAARAGNGDRAIELLEANLALLPSGALRALGTLHLTIVLGRRSTTAGVARLTQALDAAEDTAARVEIGGYLAFALTGTGRTPEAAELAAGLVAEAETASNPPVLASALANAALYELANDRPAWHLIGRLEQLRRDTPEAQPSTFGARSLALMRDGRIEEARELTAQAHGDPNAFPIWIYAAVVLRLGAIELAAGRLAVAESLADEGLILAEQMGNQGFLAEALILWAEVHAVAGRADEARRDGARALEIAVEIGAVARAARARFAIALAELACGRGVDAAAMYREVPRSEWWVWSYCAGGRASIDAVDALVGAGEVELAQEIADAMPRDASERHVAAAILAAGKGDLERAIEVLRSAAPAPAPFRRGRELLLAGRFLRRARHRGEAREALTAAAELFEEIGAQLWADRARDELARLGGRTPSGNVLTRSEERVAELVAAGLANKEVATALSVTVHTVEAHLSKIYAKLGIRSRTELAARYPAS